MTENENYMGDKIKLAREDAGWSIEKVATLAGISPRYLQKIENEGKTPSVKTLNNIILALSIDANSLFRDGLNEDEIRKNNLLMRIRECSPLEVKLIYALLDVFANEKEKHNY